MRILRLMAALVLLGAIVAAQTSTPSRNVLESLANWH
jgi:hypothetical protein